MLRFDAREQGLFVFFRRWRRDFFPTNSFALSSNMPVGSPVFLSRQNLPAERIGRLGVDPGSLQGLAVRDRAMTIGPDRGKPDSSGRLCRDPRASETLAASKKFRSIPAGDPTIRGRLRGLLLHCVRNDSRLVALSRLSCISRCPTPMM